MSPDGDTAYEMPTSAACMAVFLWCGAAYTLALMETVSAVQAGVWALAGLVATLVAFELAARRHEPSRRLGADPPRVPPDDDGPPDERGGSDVVGFLLMVAVLVVMLAFVAAATIAFPP